VFHRLTSMTLKKLSNKKDKIRFLFPYYSLDPGSVIRILIRIRFWFSGWIRIRKKTPYPKHWVYFLAEIFFIPTPPFKSYFLRSFFFLFYSEFDTFHSSPSLPLILNCHFQKIEYMIRNIWWFSRLKKVKLY